MSTTTTTEVPRVAGFDALDRRTPGRPLRFCIKREPRTPDPDAPSEMWCNWFVYGSYPDPWQEEEDPDPCWGHFATHTEAMEYACIWSRNWPLDRYLAEAAPARTGALNGPLAH